MKVLNTIIQTKKISIMNHNLKGNFKMNPYDKESLKNSDTYTVTNV